MMLAVAVAVVMVMEKAMPSLRFVEKLTTRLRWLRQQARTMVAVAVVLRAVPVPVPVAVLSQAGLRLNRRQRYAAGCGGC